MTPLPEVVVTGGAGYVGAVVTGHLLMSGYSVLVIDKLAAGGESLLAFEGHPMFRLVGGDVRDAQAMDDMVRGAQAVVHLAAVVGEPACAQDQQNARSINVGGTKAVLSAAARAGVERLILVSTCSNYGTTSPDSLADEDSPLNPLGIYAGSKVEAERMVLSHPFSLSATVLRLGTICGLSPRMRFDLLVNELARAAVLGESIQIFGPDAWRPFLHIRDAARAIACCLRSPTSAVGGSVFNVVGENYQKKALAELVRRHYPAAPIQLTHNIADARDYRVNAGRIRAQQGFEPRHTIESAFIEVARAVRTGIFRNPRWPGHSAAPAAAP